MGYQEIEDALSASRREGKVAIIPFLTVGYPNVAATLELAPALAQAGAAVFELGVPFSDPLADGATIQRTSFHALKEGVSLRTCLDVCARLRARGLKTPIVLMGYYNPILQLGLEECARAAVAAGVDGFIVADLPAEESGPFRHTCESSGLGLIPLLAPTSPEGRIAAACREARGFVYCVSLTGITGARSQLSSEVARLVQTVRRHTELPVAVGFGISTPEHVETVAEYADAAVVGSALLDVITASQQENFVEKAAAFIAHLAGRRARVPGGPRA
ncbi:MAG: tryptophan synthase subunit alpha [Chloroflexi bacterium]|nr:tryptophan synthase subunit alpha [Chloroflexota bacterium]